MRRTPRSTMLAAARDAIQMHKVIKLTTEGSQVFVEALMDPPEPNENLRAKARETGIISAEH